MNLQNIQKILNKIFQWPSGMAMKWKIIIGLLIVTLIFSWIKFSTFLFLYPLYLWITNYLTSLLGVSVYLAKTVAALIAIPLFFLIILMFSTDKTKRTIGLTAFFLFLSLCNFAMFGYSGKYIFFDINTGKALKYYIKAPAGEIIISDLPGYDQIYGKMRLPVTPNVVGEYLEQQNKKKEKLSSTVVQTAAYKSNLQPPYASTDLCNLDSVNGKYLDRICYSRGDKVVVAGEIFDSHIWLKREVFPEGNFCEAFYDLHKEFYELHGLVGVDDRGDMDHSVQFEIYTDGNLAFCSKIHRVGVKAEPFILNISNIRSLKLKVIADRKKINGERFRTFLNQCCWLNCKVYKNLP